MRLAEAREVLPKPISAANLQARTCAAALLKDISWETWGSVRPALFIQRSSDLVEVSTSSKHDSEKISMVTHVKIDIVEFAVLTIGPHSFQTNPSAAQDFSAHSGQSSKDQNPNARHGHLLRFIQHIYSTEPHDRKKPIISQSFVAPGQGA